MTRRQNYVVSKYTVSLSVLYVLGKYSTGSGIPQLKAHFVCAGSKFFYFPPPRFVQGRQEIRQPKFKVPFFDGTVYIWQMAADHQARSKTMTIDANVSTHRVSQLR